jgi:hypothetical protein
MLIFNAIFIAHLQIWNTMLKPIAMRQKVNKNRLKKIERKKESEKKSEIFFFYKLQIVGGEGREGRVENCHSNA